MTGKNKEVTVNILTSTMPCCMLCAPSTSTGMPWRWASATISFTGLTVPSTLEACVTATIRVRCEIRFAVCFKVKNPFICEWDDLQDGFFPFTQHLPGNNVGMVFHAADNDLITLLDKFLTEGKGNCIY